MPYSSGTRAFIVYIIVGPLFKLGLIIFWTRKLHRRHASRYTFWDIFWKMFYPQSESSVDHQLWTDLKPIQRWNLYSNHMLVLIAVLWLIVMSRL